jgi:murein DD-endopeptidase MepM/ murein hydrolase activator NlpD
VRLRLLFAEASGARPVASLPLGAREPGRLHTVQLRDNIPEGKWAVRLSGRDERGRRLRRTAKASAAEALSFFAHRFPVAGTGWDLGGEGSRFGADRGDHSHQGHDITAPEGTPVVAPRGGVVQHVAFQAEGAGYYVILDGEGEERDYAFMHLREGSVAVSEGQRVRTGQLLGQVGSTGASSGPHLHFEIWESGDWWNGGQPVDPLPYLQRWASWS